MKLQKETDSAQKHDKWYEDACGTAFAMELIGVLGNAVATACYIGAQLGPGPRDGLMTGLHRRLGIPIGPVRTGLEVTVVIAGWLLGGTLGIGTVVYALGIGPLVQRLLPYAIVPLSSSSR